MKNGNENGDGSRLDFDEPEHVKREFDQANQIENFGDTDYEPDLDQEFDGVETQFEIPEELEGVISSGAIRNIRSLGTTRTSIQISMSSSLRGQWYNFVETLTGNKISPGRTSASAPLVTIGMRLLMATIAKFEVQETLADLEEMLGANGKNKLRKMLDFLLESVDNEPF